MLKDLEDIAKFVILAWCNSELPPAPGGELAFRFFGEYSVTLKRDPADEVFIPGENIAGAVYVEEAVTA
jgi:hypothetical protein